MPDVRESRRRFVIVIVVLLCLDLAAAAVLMSPIGSGSRSGQQRLHQLQAQLTAKTREVVPLRGIDQKVADAKVEIDKFYKDRLPANYSSISERLGKLAAANGVKIATGTYKTEDSEVSGLGQVTVDAAISGPYGNLVKFINAVERDQMFFLIDGVDLGQQQAGAVLLKLRLETYLKE